MKTIIAGSRDHNLTYERFYELMAQGEWNITMVLSGTARGIDRMGERWAAERNIPIERYPADWDRYGKSAGYRRNVEMACRAEALVAFWDGKSRGTENMIEIARKWELWERVWRIK